MKLPVVIQKDFTSLFQYALPLCAVLSRPNAMRWYLQKYLSIFGRESEDSSIWFGYADSFDYLSGNDTNQIFDIARTSVSEIKKSNFSLLGYVKKNLQEDRYLVIFVDEFFIKTSSKYHKSHYFHEYLIFGVDETEQSMECVGFDQKNTYQKLSINLKDFVMGFESILINEDFFGFTDRMILSFHVPDFSDICTTEINHIIKKRILDYTYSVDHISNNKFYGQFLHNCDVKCGVQSIDLLIRAFEYLLDRQNYSMDVRQILLVYEIRKSIYKRGKEIITTEKERMLWENYEGVLKGFNGIYMNFVKYAYITDGEGYQVNHDLIKNRMENFEAIKKRLEVIKMTEENVLMEIAGKIQI